MGAYRAVAIREPTSRGEDCEDTSCQDRSASASGSASQSGIDSDSENDADSEAEAEEAPQMRVAGETEPLPRNSLDTPLD